MKRLGMILFFLMGAFLVGCREEQQVQPVAYPIYCQPCPQVCVPQCTQTYSNPCSPVGTVQPHPVSTQPTMPQPSLPKQ